MATDRWSGAEEVPLAVRTNPPVRRSLPRPIASTPLEVQAPSQLEEEEFPPLQKDIRAAKGLSKTTKKKSNGKDKEAKKKGEKKTKSLQEQLGITPKRGTKSSNRPYDIVDSPLRSHRELARTTRRASLQLLAEQASSQMTRRNEAVHTTAAAEQDMDTSSSEPTPTPAPKELPIVDNQDEAMVDVQPHRTQHVDLDNFNLLDALPASFFDPPSSDPPVDHYPQTSIVANHHEPETFESASPSQYRTPTRSLELFSDRIARSRAANSPSATFRQHERVIPMQLPPPSEANLTERTTDRRSPESTQSNTLPAILNFVPDYDPDISTTPHVPTKVSNTRIEYTHPSNLDFWDMPQVGDPYAFRDNLDIEVSKEWDRCQGPTLFAYFAGRGATDGKTMKKWMDLLRNIIEGTIGGVEHMRITPPHPRTRVAGSQQPPFVYLLHELHPDTYNRLLELRCIGTREGVLYFVPRNPIISSYIGTIAYFNDVTAWEIDSFVRRKLEQSQLLRVLEDLSDGMRAEQIFDTLRVDLVQGIEKDGTEYNAAHIHIDSPTSNVKEWRDLRSLIMGTSFRGAFIGMNTRPIKNWRCEVCLSALHQSHNCHIFKERGWLYPQEVERFKNCPGKRSKSAAPNSTPSTDKSANIPAPLESYSSVRQDTKNGWKDSQGKRSSGGKWGGKNRNDREDYKKGKSWKGRK